MNKNGFTIFMMIVMAAMAALSCEVPLPQYPEGSEGTVEGLGGAQRPPELTEYPSFAVESLTAPMPEDFIRGVDISNCYIIEQAGGVYYDDDNSPGDIIEILKSHGVNWVRLRLWHNHKLAQNPGPYAGDGDNDLVKTKAIARRAKAAGMKFLLNFHYSDNWADPGRQQIPSAWEGMTADQLVTAVYDYTFATILELKAAGAEPDMVQLGNEITPGLLSPTIGGNWANVARVLNSGALAVRLAAPKAKIMLHLDRGGDVSAYQNWFDRFARHNSTAATTAEVDFDVVGLSWYPYYSSHSTIDNLDSNIRNIRSRYGKEAVVAETGWAWTIAYDGDELSNLFHISQENQTALQMTDNKGYITASGISFETREGGSTKYLPASPENQAKLFRAVMDATVSAGGGGVFWWAADWIPAPGLRSNWDNQTLFDFTGKALPALGVFAITSSAGTIPPLKPANLRAAGTAIDAVSLEWNAPYGASKYALYRADTEGVWTTPLDEDISSTAYTDIGLTPDTDYWYRVKAWNEHGWGELSDVLSVHTRPLSPPANFRVSASDENSITLAWDSAEGATAYKIYHAGPSATEPDSGTYTPLSGAENISTTGFNHTGLTGNETHYYKISAIYGSHGEGLLSSVVSRATGAPPPPYATIDMTGGTLDADFQDTNKAASESSDSLSPGGSAENYDIQGLYVANDATNLYVALDFGSNQPGGYEYDRIIVLIDNTDSSAGGVSPGAGASADPSYAAQSQTIDNASIEAYAQKIMRSAATGTSGFAINATTWDRGGNYVYTPTVPNGATVIKFSIPLANIGSAVSGNTLRVFAAFSKGWNNGGNIVVGDVIPAGAATGASVEADSITIDMDNALSYTVK